MNNQIKIKVIKSKSPEEMARILELELVKLNAFASPIYQDLDTFEWVSFIYYKSINQIDESITDKIEKTKIINPKTSQSNIIPPTEKQKLHLENNRKYLESKGINLNEINTKKEASEILKSLWAGLI